MTQGRLVNLAIISTESNILREIDFTAIISDSAVAKPRKVSGRWLYRLCVGVAGTCMIIILIIIWLLYYHGLHGIAGTVLTAITLSYGKWRNSTPHRIKTPSLVDMKLWTYDYVREICPQIYFCENPCSGGFWREWWNNNISIFTARCDA